ncbi:RAD9, HUS1, RAD1-interacting nuclear orphan protein 1 isoform X2 [Artibeus jamaicensis]|uniref:RAD9, HUS1, RAD1-interacting nuclear orphan protein 1 isoform X2 n=1 Tax=Artibeus jamaicensis TaxID=9417 RepID=UPI00235AE4C9|nr:RAD9, HUS1, RAD1-interacting nuclear orphan protein 1 isoform X2 [Artibeus jamaicensis]
MPPRKKCRQTSRKAQLQFHQQPLEGSKHQYGSPQLPITHTRQVLPQFDTIVDSWFPPNRRWKHHHQDQSRHASRKSTTSKFAHLTFESPQPSSSSTTLGSPLVQDCPNHSEKDTSRRALAPILSPQSCEELSAHALQNLPYMFIVPDIQTPESSSVKQVPVPPDQRENSLPGCSPHTSTPESPEPGAVLVKDTPEEKYGVKVTWRRRKHLFTYLRERGKLNKSQFLVKY